MSGMSCQCIDEPSGCVQYETYPSEVVQHLKENKDEETRVKIFELQKTLKTE